MIRVLSSRQLLDVARETYRENIADVDELLKELQNKYPGELDDVALAYNTSNGFTFTLASNILEEKGGQLPNVFTRLVSFSDMSGTNSACDIHFPCLSAIAA